MIKRLPIAIAVAGALLLVGQWAGGRPLWLDEEMIAINIRDRSFAALAGALSLGQTAPYGWLALERLSWRAFGDSELALRFVPMAFGVATLAVAAWIGRRWLGPLGSATLVLLCALGQWLTFYFLELKPYSADACFALWIPALAVHAIEERRTRAFWIVAAIGQWFANGALLVTPASAAVLLVVSWRRGGSAALARALAPGAGWVALFAIHYVRVVRHAVGSAFLQSTWAFAFPPPSAAPLDAIRWLAHQLHPFAAKPGGTALGLWFWLAAAAGFVTASSLSRSSRGWLAIAFALVPLSGFALAMLRIVPLYERVSIWMVPALYVGVALLADAAAARRRIVGIVAAAVALTVTADVSARGLLDVRLRPTDSNRSLDDRAAIRWLGARARPGDAWVATHFALPALWWYGGTAKVDSAFELAYVSDPADCPADAPQLLENALRRYPRTIVYLGFRFDDTPPGFDDLVVDRLAALGAVTDYRRFDVRSVAIIFDRSQSSNRPATLRQLDAQPADDAVRPPGCITIKPAAMW